MSRFQTMVPVADGATGRVYRARDEQRGETVAVKRLLVDDPVLLQRFRREARTQSRLSHPNICPLYGLEQDEDGRLLIVMRYVEGSTLAEELARLELDEALDLLAQVADAIHYAHEQGVLHRDLKPANILLERRGSGWHPWVSDFGLALHRDDVGLTATGQVMGTPAYMAPEQARGERDALGPATDIFALGCMLYELLAGRPPFQGATMAESVDRLLHHDAEDPRRYRPEAPERLCRIALQCLEHDPAHRYPSAARLRDDLRQARKGSPVTARRYSRVYRLRQRFRRHPVLASLGLAAGLAVLTLGGLALWTAREASLRERAAAELAAEVGSLRSAMQIARLAPVHDLGRARSRLQARIDALGEQLRRRPVAQALVHRSLAEALLALGEPAKALEHADHALALEDDDEARRLRLSARMALYDQRARYLRGLPLERRRELLESETARWLEPAREDIEVLGGIGGLPPLAALRLLIAEDRYDEARQLVLRLSPRGAEDYLPQLARGEFKLAEGDRLALEGDRDAAISAFGEARAAYGEAAAIGRSDPRARTGSCLAAQRLLRQQAQAGGDLPRKLETLEPDCEILSRVDPGRARSWATRAGAYAALASAMDTINQRDAARGLLTEGIADAERALSLDPDSLVALDVMARLQGRQAYMHFDDYEQAQAYYQAALEATEQLLERHPAYLPGVLLQGMILRDRGRHQASFRKDPFASYEAAERSFRHALELKPDSAAVLQAYALNEIFQFYELRDRDVSRALALAQRGIELMDRVLAQDPDNVDALFDQGANHGDLWFYLAGLDEGPAGIDATAYLDRALELLAEIRRLAPERPEGYSQALMILLSGADMRLEQDRSAAEWTARARALLVAAEAQGVTLDRGMHAWLAISEVRSALVEGNDPRPAMQRAWAVLEQARPDGNDRFYHRVQTLELAGLHARWLRRQGQPNEAIIRRGDRALTELLDSERTHGVVLCPGARLRIEQALLAAADEQAPLAEAARKFLATCFEQSPDLRAQYSEDEALLKAL